MRLCNDTVTLFSYAVDAATHAPTYTAHVLTGVSWYATAAETVDPKGGLVAAHKVTVRIPAAVVPSGGRRLHGHGDTGGPQGGIWRRLRDRAGRHRQPESAERAACAADMRVRRERPC